MSERADEGTAGAIDVVFVVAPGSLLLDLAGPAEAFRLANQHAQRHDRRPRFRLRFAGPEARAESSVGLALGELEALPDGFDGPTWVVLVGRPDLRASGRPAGWQRTAEWLARRVSPLLQQDAPHRLLTVCGGAILAAEAGLVGDRRCTTHHELLELLRRLAPAATVVENRVFVEDGPLASSAGITAGIDLAIYLIAREQGDEAAAAVAQTMVVYLRRGPDDPELSPYLAHRNHLHPAVHRVQDAVCADPTRPWTASELARAGRVTPRHLSRLFAEQAGVSPRSYVQGIRVERARRALAAGADVGDATEAAGFSSDVALRRAWHRHAEGTPRQARSRGKGAEAARRPK